MTPTAAGPALRSVTALSTPPLIATATRSGSGAERTAGASAFARASTGSVSPPTAHASSRVRPRRSASTPGASASQIRPSRTRSRTAAQSGPRAESPYSSCIAPGYCRKVVGGAEAPPTMLRPRRSCRVHVNLDKPGGCRANRRHQMPRPDPGSLSHGVGSTCTRLHERGRALGSDSSGDQPARAYDQWICCTPCRPRRRASASVRSNCRPGT